jgi:hypothetical protein
MNFNALKTTILVSLVIINTSLIAKPMYGIKSSMEISAFSVESKQVNAKVFRYRMLFEKDFSIADNLTVNIKGGFDLEAGSNSSSVIDQYAPQNQFVLKNASLDWKPLSFFTIKAGALNQGKGHPLLKPNAPFIGVSEQVELELTKQHSFYLKLQQLIPNNYFLANRIGTLGDQGTPTYFDETIGTKLTGDVVSLNAEVTHFKYNDLSSSVAYQSQFIGNSISGGGELNSNYLYGFEGYSIYSHLEAHFNNDFGIDLTGRFLYNDNAPDNRNSGHILSAGLKVFDKVIYLWNFQNKSDSSPAFYNSGATGHNNMEGYAIAFRTYSSINDINRPKLQYNIEYSHKDPIETNLFQSSEDSILVSLKKNFSI